MLERSPKAKTPVEENTITLDDEDSSSSNMSSNTGGGFGAGMIRIMPANKAKTGQGVRGKYKQKEYLCPHCNKGYCDATRLKDHVDKAHEKTNDPWRDVGPNTDIAVRNNLCKTGFEVFKVVGVYSTGQRFKAARFAPVDQDKWMLTEEINKNVMKQNILKILTSLKKDLGLYKMDSEELSSLMKIISEDGKSARESRIEREKVTKSVVSALNAGVKLGAPIDGIDQVEHQVNVDFVGKQADDSSQLDNHIEQFKSDECFEEKIPKYIEGMQNGHSDYYKYGYENHVAENGTVMVEPVFENGEVMVQPVFEESYSEMDAE